VRSLADLAGGSQPAPYRLYSRCGLWHGAYPAGEPGELKLVLRTIYKNGPDITLSGAASYGPESADYGSEACGGNLINSRGFALPPWEVYCCLGVLISSDEDL
jgi:hypothetical protein